MKRMKKIIAAALSLAMLCSGITALAAKTEEYPEKYEAALTTLYSLGIIEDNTAKGYDKNVSRADFAKWTSALGGDSAVATPEPAEQDISFGEAVQMLVDMSGNSIRADYYGGYLAAANRMGITHGLSGMQDYDKVTYGMAVQMLYNTMRVTPGEFSSISEDALEYSFDENHTVLSEYMGITVRVGFVTADGFWSLNPGELPADDCLVINGVEYRLKNPSNDDWVGFEVNYYYNEADDEIVAVEKSKNSEQVTLNSRYVKSFKNDTYTYDADGKTKTYRLDKNVYIVSNYEANLSADVNMYPENSDIVLIDADGNGKYETVLIKAYTEITVQALVKDSDSLASKLGEVFDLDKNEPARVTLDGEIKDYSAVKSGMHASLVVNGDNVVREINLSNTKVSGTIISCDVGDKDSTVTIDDAVYAVSEGMLNAKNLETGNTVELILNFRGEVANVTVGAETSTEAVTQFGYLIKMRQIDETESIRMKLLTADGKIESYDLVEDVKINNRKTENADVLTLFGTGDETDKQVIYYTLDADNHITKIRKAVTAGEVSYGDRTLHVSLDGTYRYQSNIFDYKLLVGEATTVFYVPKNNSSKDYDYTVGIADVRGEEDYKVKAYNFEKNSAYADAVVVYRNTSSGVDGVCGGPGPIPNLQYGNLCLVTDVKKVYNEDLGEAVNMVSFTNLTTGTAETKILADNAAWYIRSDGSTDYDLIDYVKGYGSKDLQTGDLFHWAANSSGEIGSVSKAYDASDKTLVKGTYTKNNNTATADYTDSKNFGSFYASYRVSMGYAVDSGDNYMVINKTLPTSLSSASRSDMEYFTKHSKTKVYRVKMDGKNAEVSEISLGEIVPSSSMSSKTVVYTSWTGLYSAVVYDYED